MPDLTVTLVGGPTALLEYGGLRLLTDPTFDDAPRTYGRDDAPTLQKTEGPAITADQIGDVDVVLISHDHHPDNLDESGRAYLPRAGAVITTAAGAERLGGGAIGLEPWAVTEVGAIPSPRSPPSTGPTGPTTSRAPSSGSCSRPTGCRGSTSQATTRPCRSSRRIVERLGVMELAVLFAGGACLEGRFDGALLTLGSAEAAQAARVLGSRAVIPVHQEGWAHFSAPPEELRHAFDEAGLSEVLVLLAPGQTAAV